MKPILLSQKVLLNYWLNGTSHFLKWVFLSKKKDQNDNVDL